MFDVCYIAFIIAYNLGPRARAETFDILQKGCKPVEVDCAFC